MKNKYIMLVSIAQIITTLQLSADHVITFFIRPYPHAQTIDDQHAMIKKLHKPGKLAKYHLKKLSRHAPTAGIFCTYAGFMDISNRIGQVTFPRKHEEPELSFVITNRISPMLMAGNTIHHWKLTPDNPATQYSAKRKQDEQTGLWYWNVQKIEPPKDRIVPAKSVLIFAKPKNLFIPEGITPTTDNPSLVLPTVYSRKNINIMHNALFVLAIRQFFASGMPDIKRNGKMYQMHQVY